MRGGGAHHCDAYLGIEKSVRSNAAPATTAMRITYLEGHIKGSEIGILGAAWLQDHGLPVGSETAGLSSRVPRAAPRLQMQPEEPVVASCGPAKTAALTGVPWWPAVAPQRRPL